MGLPFDAGELLLCCSYFDLPRGVVVIVEMNAEYLFLQGSVWNNRQDLVVGVTFFVRVKAYSVLKSLLKSLNDVEIYNDIKCPVYPLFFQ